MTHWHVVERAWRLGGKDRDLPVAHATAQDARAERDALQTMSNVHGGGRRYAVRSCDRRECG